MNRNSRQVLVAAIPVLMAVLGIYATPAAHAQPSAGNQAQVRTAPPPVLPGAAAAQGQQASEVKAEQIPPLSVSGSLANSLKLQEEYAVEKITLDTVDMRLKRMIIERKIKCIQEGKASEECEGKKSPAGLTSPGAAASFPATLPANVVAAPPQRVVPVVREEPLPTVRRVLGRDEDRVAYLLFADGKEVRARVGDRVGKDGRLTLTVIEVNRVMVRDGAKGETTLFFSANSPVEAELPSLSPVPVMPAAAVAGGPQMRPPTPVIPALRGPATGAPGAPNGYPRQ